MDIHGPNFLVQLQELIRQSPAFPSGAESEGLDGAVSLRRSPAGAVGKVDHAVWVEEKHHEGSREQNQVTDLQKMSQR